MYNEHQIREAIPGQLKAHTFTRALLPRDASESQRTAQKMLSKIDINGSLASSTSDEQPETTSSPVSSSPEVLSDELCRIMVHDKAHLNPPYELWTRNNFAQIEQAVGKPLPLLQESGARGHLFGFLGWYRVVRCTVCKGGGAEVMEFIQKRKISQTARTPEYWRSALQDDWARVVLERVNDPALGNPMAKAVS